MKFHAKRHDIQDFYLAIISKGGEQRLSVQCGVTGLEVTARHKHIAAAL